MTIDHMTHRAYAFGADVRTARVDTAMRRGWHVVARSGGLEGWGDAAAWPGFGADHDTVARALAAVIDGPLGGPLPTMPSPVIHALEQAVLDLRARRSGLSVGALLAEGDQPRAAVSAHVLVADAGAARRAVKAGARALKVKVGYDPLAADDARVGAIRDVAPGIELRLDANGAWTRATAPDALATLARHRPAWIEQPLPAADLAGLAALRRRATVPLAVDEGLVHHGVAALDAADVAVIKPMFVGGIRAAKALAIRARARGLGVCVTHALESVVGRLGALHLAAAIGGDAAHGIAGDGLCAVVDGVVHVPSGPGLGFGQSEVAA